MATFDNDSGDTQSSSNDIGNILSTTAQTQLSLISLFQQWLSEVEDHGSIVTRIQGCLNNYEQWLRKVENGSYETVEEDAETWAMDCRLNLNSGNGTRPVITVTGPGPGDPTEITAKDEEEAKRLMGDEYLGYMIEICAEFSQFQTTLQALLEVAKDIRQETSKLSQPPEQTVRTHIRLLQEYNDIKDIAQQLIGLVAENRGVPVRELYETGEFGVGGEH